MGVWPDHVDPDVAGVGSVDALSFALYGYYGHVMRTVAIADLKNNLSKYLAEVRAGEQIVIRDRNVPVAKIVPLFDAGDVDAEEQSLAAAGKVRLPESKLPRSFWSTQAPRVPAKRILAALEAERGEE
jgi:prevent-host-death family protein